MMYLVSVPSRFSRDQQARWWEPLAPVVDGLVLSTIFIQGTVVRLVDLPEAIVPTFHQKAFDELFGQWLPEQQPMNWQSEWTRNWLLVPMGPTQQRLEDVLAGHVSTAIVRGYWFKGWKHAVALSFPKEQQANLLPLVAAAGWKRLPIPSPIISQTSTSSIARLVAKPASYLPYVSSGAAQSFLDSEVVPVTLGDNLAVAAVNGHVALPDGASPLLIADERLSVNLGVTPIGETVRVAWMPLRMQVYAEQASLISFLLMMLDRFILGDEERSTPSVCILPPSCRDLQAIPALAQRIRFLDPADLYRSSTIPLNFLSPERRNAVFAKHGVRLGGATVPATTGLADFLRDHGAAHLCTAPILAFTAPQPADEQQDELIAVLKQGGGIVLFGEDTWETRLLCDLLWALVEQEILSEEIPICVMTHAGICPPLNIEQRAVHVQFNPVRALHGQTHVEVRSNLDHWIIRDFAGEQRILDGDLYAASTDQTDAVVEQLVTAFGEMNIPLRRFSPYDQDEMVSTLDNAIASLFVEASLPSDQTEDVASKSLPVMNDFATVNMGSGRNGEGHDIRSAQKRTISVQTLLPHHAYHLKLRYAIESMYHQSIQASDLLRASFEDTPPCSIRYWWEAWLSGVGKHPVTHLLEEVTMRQKLHPLGMRLLMESQLMGDPRAVAQYSLMVVGDGEPLIEKVFVATTQETGVVAEPVLPSEMPKPKRRSLSSFKG